MKAKFQSLRAFIPAVLTTVLFTQLGSQQQPKPKDKSTGNPTTGQQVPASPTFKATTRLVVVDVVATDSKGEPVTDLEPGDFTLFENGKQQQVSSFSLQLPEASPSSHSEPTPADLPSNVFTNVPRYRKTSVWNVLLLDYMNSQVISQADLRQQLIKVLDKIPDEPLAVYFLTEKLYLLQDFSTDREGLKQLILGLKNHASPRLDNPKGGKEMERYPAGFFARMTPAQQEAVLRMESEMTGHNAELRLRDTVAALNKIVRNVSALPGRKNLIWVSQGFPFAIEPGTVVGWDAATRRGFEVSVPGTANGLFDSQVAIYPVDPSGRVPPIEFDPAGRGTDSLGRKETSTGPNNAVSAQHDDERIKHASLNELAERTGGRAFYNMNDIGVAIVRSMHDGAIYYTLAYYPTDKNWNGKFRRIAVKVSRSGVKLRHREGYFAFDPDVSSGGNKVRAEQAAVFREAMELDSPVSTALLFKATVVPSDSPQAGRVVVDFQLQPGAVSTESAADDLQHVSVECAVQAFNARSKPVNAAGTTMAGNLKPEAYAQISREGFSCRQALDLHPGKYLLRLGVRDDLSGRIGTADASVTVPEPAPQN